jgi:hypothetical protein
MTLISPGANPRAVFGSSTTIAPAAAVPFTVPDVLEGAA